MTKIQGQIITNLLTRFPKAATKTIARMAYKENPKLWHSVESVRSSVRYYRGAAGSKHLSKVIRNNSEHIRACQQPCDPFAAIPDGLTFFNNWEALQIDGPLKALILSDAHIPYHNKQSLIAALKFGRDNGASMVFLNGDMSDCFSLSKWEKDPRKRDFAEEKNTVVEFLRTLRALFPKARIIWKDGNHEERYIRYMQLKAPELLGLQEFDLKEVFQLAEFGVQHVGEKRPVRLGDLNVLHGHEYPFAISNPVNPARGLFLRAKTHALCGHFHQPSYHSEKDLEETVTGCWSTGCLCDLHPDYAPLNKWGHGFAFVEVGADGKFDVVNKFISGGKVY